MLCCSLIFRIACFNIYVSSCKLILNTQILPIWFYSMFRGQSLVEMVDTGWAVDRQTDPIRNKCYVLPQEKISLTTKGTNKKNNWQPNQVFKRGSEGHPWGSPLKVAKQLGKCTLKYSHHGCTLNLASKWKRKRKPHTNSQTSPGPAQVKHHTATRWTRQHRCNRYPPTRRHHQSMSWWISLSSLSVC